MNKKTKWEKYGVIVSLIGVGISLIFSVRSCCQSKNANETAIQANNLADTANIIAKQANDISSQLLEIEKKRDTIQTGDRKKQEEDAQKKEIENILSQANTLFYNKEYEEAYFKYEEYKTYRPNDRAGGKKFETLSKNILAADPHSEEGKKYQQWANKLLK